MVLDVGTSATPATSGPVYPRSSARAMARGRPLSPTAPGSWWSLFNLKILKATRVLQITSHVSLWVADAVIFFLSLMLLFCC